MSQADASTESGDAVAGAERGEASTGRGLSAATRYARRAVRSGALFGAIGAVSLARGLRDLRRGEVGGGLVRLLAGGGFVAAALALRGSTDGGALGGDRSAGVNQTDVADTGVDIESAAGTGTERESATGDEAAEVVGTSGDVEDAAASGTELDSDVDSSDVDQTDVVDTGVGGETADEGDAPDRSDEEE